MFFYEIGHLIIYRSFDLKIKIFTYRFQNRICQRFGCDLGTSSGQALSQLCKLHPSSHLKRLQLVRIVRFISKRSSTIDEEFVYWLWHDRGRFPLRWSSNTKEMVYKESQVMMLSKVKPFNRKSGTLRVQSNCNRIVSSIIIVLTRWWPPASFSQSMTRHMRLV